VSEGAGEAASEPSELEVDAGCATVLITMLDSSNRHGPSGGNEVVKDFHHRGRGLDLREVADSGEHFKPTTRHGVVSGVTNRDRDDPILITSNQQDR
jgi:hypothetical protein